MTANTPPALPTPPAMHAPAPESLRDDMALSCGRGTHAHALELQPDGSFVVYSFPDEKNQPDLRMDGVCHDDDQSDDVVGDRQVLPVPGKSL